MGFTYRSNPDAAADSAFAPGRVALLVAGNEGRLLDPRRTPVRVLRVDAAQGLFEVEVLDFEDRGARWRVPMEQVTRFQFGLGCPEATAEQIRDCDAAVTRCDRSLQIPCQPEARVATLARIAKLRAEASVWLDTHATFFAGGGRLDLSAPTGPEALQADLERYMAERDLLAMEQALATHLVSNPWPLGVLLGHRIVLAELGLCPYEGLAVREAALFEGPDAKPRRADHICARMAFVQATLARSGHEESLTLYRGMSFEGQLLPPRNHTFVSATPNRAIAEQLYDAPRPSGALLRHPVPITRVFMTYFETRAMNHPFEESEALLLYEAEALF